MMFFRLILTLSALALAGCGESTSPDTSASDEPTALAETVASSAAEPETSIYEQAVANAGRTDADRERDAGRKPAEVLAFLGIERGMTVLDMFSGGGYYTELLSYLVGPEGRVVAHTNSAYADFLGEETTARYGDNRLANVGHIHAENNELELAANEYDAIMLVLAYHDIYLVDEENDWPAIDGDAFREELLKGLKPGGMLAVIDHSAAAGSPSETGGTLHRIDPQLVTRELEASGFVLDSTSDVLRNPDDDLGKSMYDPEVRGKTDRFVMKFRKPE